VAPSAWSENLTVQIFHDEYTGIPDAEELGRCYTDLMEGMVTDRVAETLGECMVLLVLNCEQLRS